jgi:FkbM family methyltransferase
LDYVDDLDFVRDRDIIDAGAFIGDSALILAPLTKRNVYCFEPVPSNFALMEQTIALNKLENVVPIPLALSDREQTLNFSIGGSASNCFATSRLTYSGEVEVQAVALDTFVEEHKLEVGLIKTDLEGAEQLFLAGALNTIKRFRPILLISIYHTIDDFFDIKPMIEDWDLGYKFKICKPLDGSIMLETTLIAEVHDK